jgi:hypothetical protein
VQDDGSETLAKVLEEMVDTEGNYVKSLEELKEVNLLYFERYIIK